MTDTSTHSLVTKAMVMNLSIGIWQGYRLDKTASAKVTSDAGAAADAARVNKHLIPKDALAAIVTASNAIRTHFYSVSLPWRDNGDRLLPRAMYTKFIEGHEALKDAFNEHVRVFLDERYVTAIEQAEFRMGAMFNRDDYPTASALRHKFYADLEINPVTTYNDFRVQIDQDHVDKIKTAMEQQAETRLQAAVGDVWKRMADAVGYFEQRMATPDAVFRDTTVTNIAEMLDLIPGLNVLDDPNVEAVRQAIAKSLGGIDAKDIRKDPALREELAGEAGKIMETMRGFMSAFGSNTQ